MIRHQFTTAKAPWIMGDRVFNHLKRAEGLYPVDTNDNRLNLASDMAKLLHVQEMLVAGRVIRDYFDRSAGAVPPRGSVPSASSGGVAPGPPYQGGPSPEDIWNEFKRRDAELTRQREETNAAIQRNLKLLAEMQQSTAAAGQARLDAMFDPWPSFGG